MGIVLDSNDREVIEACQRGDSDAFRVLFEAHKDRVYSIALRYSGDRAAAMDIAQDAFLKVLGRIQEFRGEAGFESWLYRIVLNTCVDHQRRGRRMMPFLGDLIAQGETVLHRLMRVEAEGDVQRIVARLPVEQRVVVVLRYTEGLSYEQIAGILGCSPGTVASRLNRAHKVLERKLGHLRGMVGNA